MTDDGTPSWAAAPRREPRADRERPTAVLVAAALAAGALAVVEASHVLGRDELVPAFRGGLALLVLGQAALAALLLRRSAGAALGLGLCQLTTVVAALGGGFGSPRLAYAGGAIVVAVLVVLAARDFPSPTLPPIS